MTPDEITRAKLYARSHAYAVQVGNPKLAQTFERRGKALAGDVWESLYADRDRDGVTNQDEQPKPKTRKGK